MNQKLMAAVSLLAAWVLALAVLPFGGITIFAEESAAAEREMPIDLSGKGGGYSAVMYDNTNGLPTSEANCIAQTAEGFLWIGSYSGLIRYDGSNFERLGSSSGVNSVVSLFVDSQNRLWVGTNDCGAAVMINGKFTMFNKSTGLTALSVRSITEDADGNFYLATTSGLAVVDSTLHMKMLDEPRLNSEYIRRVYHNNGTVFGVTKSGAIFTLKNQKLERFLSPETLGMHNVHSVLPDPDNPGHLYVGSQGSMLYYGKLTDDGFEILRKHDISPCSYVNEIKITGDVVWVCTDSGIGFLTGDSFVPIQNVPMNTSVEHLTVDYQNNLWFASSQQGVMKIVRDQFMDVFEQNSLSSEVVYATCTYEDKLLIGTKNTGLVALDSGGLCKEIPIKSSVSASGKTYNDTDLLTLLRGIRIRSIVRDSKERLWISTYSAEGLLCYDHGALTKFTEADGLPSSRVRTVHECKDGRYLAACTGGLAVINDGAVEKVFDEKHGITNTEILTVAEGENGEYLIGTDGDGIYAIKGEKVSHISTADGLGSEVIMRIKKDQKHDVFWIITSNSIAFMTGDYVVNTITQFPYSNNFDLYQNSRDEMWILSSNGIYVVDAETMLQNKEINYLFYNRDNGLPCITTSNSYSELTADGDLYIAGTTGVAKVNIEKPFENVSDIKIAVPYVEADGAMVFPDAAGEYKIGASVQKLVIHSFVYNYSLINPQVTYSLEGFDAHPATVLRSELRPQSYTNLRGGSYEFRLEIQDPHGLSQKELVVPIVKQKHLYEQFWVQLVCLLFLLAAAVLVVRQIIRRRTAALTKRSKEQKQLIREIVEAFSKVIDMKDQYTKGHSARVAEYTVMLARELGVDEETIENYYCIALLHDIGKVGVPPEVLNKPGKLTDEEFRVIKSHPALGFDTLKNISIMPDLATGAGAHHERPDGKGYPNGLKQAEIPRVAQIIAVADTFDAMYSDRPYRKRMNFEKAVSIIKDCRGTQLTDDVVDAFLRLVEQGKMRAADDQGGGTTEDIDNIHKKQQEGS